MTISCACLALWSCSEDGVAIDRPGLSPEQQLCLSSANYMIDIARDAVADTSGRPERRESRRVLMEDWVARIEAGEDPCSVYEAIAQSTNAF